MALENGLQCKIIVGFGKTICAQLEERLQRHREAEAEAEGKASGQLLNEKSGVSENSVPLPPTSSSEDMVTALKKKTVDTSHLPSFPLSPVPPKSPPFRQIENLQLSPSRLALLPKLLPVTNSPSWTKISHETPILSLTF